MAERFGNRRRPGDEKDVRVTARLRKAPKAEPGGEPDGRRRRGNASRALLVDALRKLVGQGEYTPSAARVAAVAGVSLRTVFRHFAEMDSLYKEISESLQARVLPLFFQPYRSEAWREKLAELLDRRIEIYETILPFKISGDLRRFQSEYLMKDHRQHLALEKTTLESLLPGEVAADAVLFRALVAATSFQTWRILRKDQELSPAQAREVVERSVDALLAGSPAASAGARGKRTGKSR